MTDFNPQREVHYFADTNTLQGWTFREACGWAREADGVAEEWNIETFSYHRHNERPATWMGDNKANPMPRIKI